MLRGLPWSCRRRHAQGSVASVAHNSNTVTYK